MNSRVRSPQDDEDFDRRLMTVEARVAELEKKLSLLEAASPSPSPVAAPSVSAGRIGPTEEVKDQDQTTPNLAYFTTLLGRSLVVLGGGYFLRAITESGIVPPWLGLGLGIPYALFWLFAMGRAANRGEVGSARCHCLMAALLAYPLIWEGAVHFSALSQATTAGVLALVLGCAYGLAYRAHRPGLASLHAMLTTLTAILIWIQAGGAVPLTLLALATATVTMILAERQGSAWRGLRYPLALFANLAVLLASRAAHPFVAMTLDATLIVVTLACCAWSVSRSHRAVGFFEVAQTFLAIAIGYGGAIRVAMTVGGRLDHVIGAIGLLIAALSYGFPALSSHRRIPANFFYFTTVGLVFGVIGSSLLFHEPVWGWALFSLVVLTLGQRMNKITFSLHAALLAITAAAASGLLTLGAFALLARGAGPWPGLEAVGIVVVLALFIGALTPAPTRTLGRASDLPQLLQLTTLVWVVAGMLLNGFRLLLAPGDLPLDPGWLATARTTVLAVSATTFTLLSRHARFAVARTLVVPILLLGGIKFLAEDLLVGRPTTLFAALAVYGAALILVPRLWATSPGSSDPRTPPSG